MKLLGNYCAVLVNSFGTTRLMNRHRCHGLMLHQIPCLYDVQELVVASYTETWRLEAWPPNISRPVFKV